MIDYTKPKYQLIFRTTAIDPIKELVQLSMYKQVSFHSTNNASDKDEYMIVGPQECKRQMDKLVELFRVED